jgi:penicillin amidase
MPDLNALLSKLAKTALTPLSRPPKLEGEIKISGLGAPVEVKRDRWGVPHLFAQSLPDLFTAQGFIHAQERLFQMEFNRRLVAGRLSEVLGELTLPLDRWMRTLTMRRVAEFEVGLLADEDRSLLEAYAAGVTAFIQAGSLPVEFTLLRYQPEPWLVADSLAWVKMMAWTLSENWSTELIRARLIDRLGPEKAAELDPDYRPEWPTVLPDGFDYSGIGTSAVELAQAARPFIGPSPYEGLGSNNWAVHGTRTASGSPLLANDMHLGLSIPAIWFENHLHCPEVSVIGVSFPGIPGILAGHNGRVAWGYTNGFPDVQDLYMEKLRRTADGGAEVEFQGEWEPATVLQETIQVKGGEAAQHEVIVTRHGPVINSLNLELTGETPLALRWTALEPNLMITSLVDMMRAADVHALHEALRGWHTPAQNVVYADIHGDIGYTLPGKIPIRAKGDGQLPVPGWSGEYEWQAYIPFEALPHSINPPAGYIATANNRVTGRDYPYYLGRETISPDRVIRIVELLEAQPRLALADIQAMHFDQVCPSARRLTELLAGFTAADPEQQTVLALLQNWDGTLAPDSAAAAVYEVFYRRAITILLANRLDEFVLETSKNGRTEMEARRTELAEYYLGKGPVPVLFESNLFGFRALEWLLDLLAQPDSPWYDLGGGQDRAALIRAALGDTLSYLKAKLGPQPTDWQWGKLHQLLFAHPLGSQAVLSGFLNRGPYPLGGDQNTVWATGSRLHTPEGQQLVGPPYRMIVDLGNLENSRSILAPGQSGRPGTPHYDDQIGDWFQGNYHPMLFTEAQLADEPLKVLRLAPEE